MAAPAFSIVVCSIDAAKYERVTATYRALFAGTPHEIIGIHDARSLAEAYNRAARTAGGDIVVFSHDDIDIVSADLAEALTRAFATLDVVGIAGTSRLLNAFWPAAGHPFLRGWISMPNRDGPGYWVHVFGVDGAQSADLQAVDGVFFAVRREVLAAIEFDAQTFDGFHGYDVDFSYAAHCAGFRVGSTAEIALIHASGGHFDARWRIYVERFAQKYKQDVPEEEPAKRWSFARVLVPAKDDIVSEFPLERLVAITRRLRGQG